MRDTQPPQADRRFRRDHFLRVSLLAAGRGRLGVAEEGRPAIRRPSGRGEEGSQEDRLEGAPRRVRGTSRYNPENLNGMKSWTTSRIVS